jgi:pilus assembly protein Flp/PilA
MKKSLVRFLKEEEGASAVEYGMLLAAVTAAIILLVFALGDRVVTAFTQAEANWR